MGRARLNQPRTRTTESIATETDRPLDWEKAISVAYLRITGSTQAEAAGAAGTAERTVRGWEASKWWPQAVEVAHSRWLQGVDNIARKAIPGFVEKDATTTRWYAERRFAELAPPMTTGSGGGGGAAPISINIQIAKERVMKAIKRGK